MMQIFPWKGGLFFVSEMIRKGDADSPFAALKKNSKCLSLQSIRQFLADF